MDEDPREQGQEEPSTDEGDTEAADDVAETSDAETSDAETAAPEPPTTAGGGGMEPALAGAGAREGPSTVDAMGLDKRRAVVGKSYGPSRTRQLAVFAIFFASVGVLFVGGKLLADKLDEPPKSNPDKAPWSKPSAPQIPAKRPM